MPDYVCLIPGYGTLWTTPTTVYRIGFPPHTFAWAPPQHDMRTGRWDDPTGNSRTTYVAEQLLGALLESLAQFTPDPVLEKQSDLDELEEDPQYPTAAAGDLDRTWITRRSAGRAQLSGRYLDIRAAATIAGLRARYRSLAHGLGFDDLDAGALKSANRALTQTVGNRIRELPDTLDGICFASRHGDHLLMWAVFEHTDHATSVSPQLTDVDEFTLTEATPELVEVMTLLNLRWVGTSPLTPG